MPWGYVLLAVFRAGHMATCCDAVTFSPLAQYLVPECWDTHKFCAYD